MGIGLNGLTLLYPLYLGMCAATTH